MTRSGRAWLVVWLAIVLARPALGQNRAAAEALFQAGRAALQKGDYATACEKFAESHRLDPAVGTLMNLAECNEKLGKLATAWQLFNQSTDLLAENDPRKAVARERARDLERRLPKVVIRLDPSAPTTSSVKLDDTELRAASLGVALPVDPGRHRIEVSAPGHEPRSFELEMLPNENREIVVAPGAASGEAPPPESNPLVPIEPAVVATPPKQPEPKPRERRFAIFARTDADIRGKGAVFAPGLAYSPVPIMAIAVAGLIGRHKGFEPSVNATFLDTTWSPRSTLGAPTFFVDGKGVLGMRIAFGASFRASRAVNLFGQPGVAYFSQPPEGYGRWVPLVSVGVELKP